MRSKRIMVCVWYFLYFILYCSLCNEPWLEKDPAKQKWQTMKLYWSSSLTCLIISVHVWRAANQSKNMSPAKSLFELSFLGGISSPWLWTSSSPPPVTSLTITLSELFLLLCGKMAGRKCVYTVILLSVCAVWPRPEISFGMLSSIFS